MTHRHLISLLGALVVSLACVSIAQAADGTATFASFYEAKWTISWGWAALAALLVGILVFIGIPVLGPVMAPAISAIGTSIGGLFGLSGIAATNFGLALLGGGALSAGGLGIVGGTTLLAATLTFGTEVVIDYTVGSLTTAYDQKKFEAASHTLMTLPFPRMKGGTDSVAAAIEELQTKTFRDAWACMQRRPDSLDVFKGCMAGQQIPPRQRVKNAIATMKQYKPTPKMTMADDAQRRAMLALLYFIDNDYMSAKEEARKAYALGLKIGHQPTLPAFIESASVLYEERPNFKDSFERFEYAVKAEPENALVPLLFATYLDRLSYRLNESTATLDDLKRVAELAESLPRDERKLAVNQIVLAHNLMQAKVAQQRILSLTGTTNQTVRNNPRTPRVVKAALDDYGVALASADVSVKRQESLLAALRNDASMWARLKRMNPFSKGDPYTDQEASLNQLKETLAEYEFGKAALVARVATFDQELKAAKSENSPPQAPEYEQVAEKEENLFLRWFRNLVR